MLRKQYPIGTRRTCFVVFLSLLLTVALAARPAQAQTYTPLSFTHLPLGRTEPFPGPIIRDPQGQSLRHDPIRWHRLLRKGHLWDGLQD